MKSLPTIFLMLIMLLSCSSDDQVEIADDSNEVEPPLILTGNDFNILFLGNSLTSANGLPNLVVERAQEANGLVIGTKTISYGNYAIIDHWNDGDA
ncbi:MAG: hypothetical protein RIF33_05130 [Cyclobacteriaceae bacterium]